MSQKVGLECPQTKTDDAASTSENKNKDWIAISQWWQGSILYICYANIFTNVTFYNTCVAQVLVLVR